MTSSWIRRGLWVLGIAAVAAALIVAALPYVASNRIVRDRIALEMSRWTGYRVTISGSPQIEVWPQLSAVLTEVSLSRWGDPERNPVIYAERVEIGLAAMAALRGEVSFSSTRLIRPTIRVERNASGLYLPPLPDSGSIGYSIELAREMVKSGAAEPDPTRVPAGALGNVEIRDGRIVAVADGKDSEILSGLSARANWPAPGAAASFSASAIWRGENVTVEAATQKPLALAAGSAAPLSFAVKSAPANLSFEGKAGLVANPFMDGDVKFQSPSLRRVMEWTGMRTASSATTIAAVSISSHVSGGAERVKFDNAQITLDKNPGTGALDLAFGENGRPTLSGTLAFETLDLGPFVSAFTPLAAPAGLNAGDIDATLAGLINLDLRLSAGKATAGPIPLNSLAATVQVRDGLSVFDVSDASAFGGNIQTGIRFDRTPGGTQAEMRLLASDINGAAFGEAVGMTRLMPTGKGNVSVILKGPGKGWNSIMENADGSISASFGPGSLSGLDLAAFVKRNAAGGFFPLDEVANGSVPIDGAEFKASVAKGVVRIEKAQASQGGSRLWLTGIMPYAGRGLALTGGISSQQPVASNDENGEAPAPQASQTWFFVGGSWSAPFISPISGSAPN